MSNTVTLERPAEHEPEVAKLFPGILPSIGWVAVFLLLQVVAGVAALGYALAVDGGARPPMAVMQDLAAFALPMIWALVISEIFLLGLLWLYLRKGDRLSAVYLDRWSKMSLILTIGIAAVLIGAGLAFNWAYGEYIVPNIEVQAELRRLFAAIPDTLPNSILLFVTIAVVAPLLEEILFRGLLQNSLENFAHEILPEKVLKHSFWKQLPIWAAIGLSALIFGAMHMDFYAMPPLVLMGAIFGVIYHLTGSLRVTIVLHMINNAAALALG
jgi:membrane protease YdiL (CAAX protease family)